MQPEIASDRFARRRSCVSGDGAKLREGRWVAGTVVRWATPAQLLPLCAGVDCGKLASVSPELRMEL